jgi:hypothetical protein
MFGGHGGNAYTFFFETTPLAHKFFFALTSIGLRINLSSGPLPVRIEEDHKGNGEKTSCYLRIKYVSFEK